MSARGALAVVFDLDGTLVDTIEDIADAVNHVLSEGGHPTHDLAAYRRMIGNGARKLVERALPPEGGNLVEPTLAAFRERYASHLVVKTRLYPGVAQLLDALEQQALPCAIVSNKPDGLTAAVVDRLLGRWRWAYVAGQREGVPAKPAPDLALEASEALGVAPGRCLFVGDSSVDMQTAVAAGMVPLGVLWGFRSKDELVAHGARRVVEDPADILALLATGLPS